MSAVSSAELHDRATNSEQVLCFQRGTYSLLQPATKPQRRKLTVTFQDTGIVRG